MQISSRSKHLCSEISPRTAPRFQKYGDPKDFVHVNKLKTEITNPKSFMVHRYSDGDVLIDSSTVEKFAKNVDDVGGCAELEKFPSDSRHVAHMISDFRRYKERLFGFLGVV